MQSATDVPALREIAEARRRLEGGELERLREAAGLSFADIAHELRADRWVVARWFRHQRRPDAEHLLALIAVLDGYASVAPPGSESATEMSTDARG